MIVCQTIESRSSCAALLLRAPTCIADDILLQNLSQFQLGFCIVNNKEDDENVEYPTEKAEDCKIPRIE